MKPGQGKNKGSDFERKVCAKLSLWLSNNERDDLLCRTVGSGAQYTSTAKGIPGDIRAQDGVKAFAFCEKFVVECKHWRDLEIIRLLLGQGALLEAIKKVQDEALGKKKQWMLIAKQNNRPELVFMSTALNKYWLNYNVDHHVLFVDMITVVTLDTFLKVAKSDDLINELSTGN